MLVVGFVIVSVFYEQLIPFTMSENNKMPGLPSMMLPKSDLLSRVGAFLPKMEAANKGELCRGFNSANISLIGLTEKWNDMLRIELDDLSDDQEVRLDLQLEADENEEDSDDSDSSSSSSDDEEEEDEEKDFLIRPAKKEKAVIKEPEKAIETVTKEKPQTIEFKLALGQFENNNPIMNLLGDDAEDDNQQPNTEKDEVEDSKISNLLQATDNKRKRKGPLITELS